MHSAYQTIHLQANVHHCDLKIQPGNQISKAFPSSHIKKNIPCLSCPLNRLAGQIFEK